MKDEGIVSHLLLKVGGVVYGLEVINLICHGIVTVKYGYILA